MFDKDAIRPLVEMDEATGIKSHFIEGIFMSHTIKNRNGRVYPSNVLLPEIARYQKEFVTTSRAFGELGHPCFWDKTEILTTDGFKIFSDLDGDESVFTQNKTGQLEIQKINKVVINDYNGKMIRLFKTRGLDTVVSPNHRFLVKNDYGNKSKYVTAQEIIDYLDNKNEILTGHWYIPKGNSGLLNDNTVFTLKGATTFKNPESLSEKRKPLLNDIDIDLETFSAFMGLYLAEGTTRLRNNKYNIIIYQKEGEKADRIRDLLFSNMEPYFKWSEKTYGNNMVSWLCMDRRLGEYLKPLGVCYDKYVPDSLLHLLNEKSAKAFLDFFILGDGRGSILEKYTKCDVFSTSEELIDNIIQIISIAGYSSQKDMRICTEDYVFADRIIKYQNKKPIYFAKIYNTKGIYFDKRFLKYELLDWNDKIYCVQVDNENFIARDNNYTFWSGNSGPTINLERASHMIKDLREDGTHITGKAKIIDTPAGKIVKTLIDEGASLGVSSRGMGSVKDQNEASIVQNDFRLAAVDIVADPSAPDAFVRGIMEDKEWIYNAEGTLVEKGTIHGYKQQITKATSRKLQTLKVELFENFLRKLSGNISESLK